MDHTTDHPCNCEKGRVIGTTKSDDWNRTKESFELCCEECAKKYELKHIWEIDRKGIGFDSFKLVEK